MSVGNQSTSAQINGLLTQLAVAYRGICTQMANLNTQVNGQGNGQAYLESIGFSTSDATAALQFVDYFSTLSGIYFGQANQPADFNFNNAFSELWGGNV